MEDFTPSNLDPISEVLHRVRSLKKPNMKEIDCQTLEKRFCDQDWITQLDIYEVWLDIDNAYTINCLYRRLCSGYWELLRELIEQKKSERAKEIASRIERNCITHMRMQIVAFFVSKYMPIDILRKYKRLLAHSLEIAYVALAERLGGDPDFQIDKERLYPILSYYEICVKFNLNTSDEEALADFKNFMETNWIQLSLDFPQSEYDKILNMSLLQNADIKRWYESIKILKLNRVVKIFERFDNSLKEKIIVKFNEDENCIEFPGLPMERQYQYWYQLRNMAKDEIIQSRKPEQTLKTLLQNNPELSNFVEKLDLTIDDPLRL